MSFWLQGGILGLALLGGLALGWFSGMIRRLQVPAMGLTLFLAVAASLLGGLVIMGHFSDLPLFGSLVVR